MTRARFVSVVLLVYLASCKLGTESSPRMLNGVIELRNAQPLAQIPGPYLVSMDSIHIDVMSGGGADRHFDGRKLAATDTIVTANTRVLPGRVDVSARVMNARRDTLFAGNTTGTVTTEGFQLSLTLVPLRPVLAVSPASLTFALGADSTFQDSITIYNRGISALTWQAQFTGCGQNQCVVATRSDSILAGGQRVVIILYGFQSAASGTLIVRSLRDSLAIPFQAR